MRWQTGADGGVGVGGEARKHVEGLCRADKWGAGEAAHLELVHLSLSLSRPPPGSRRSQLRRFGPLQQRGLGPTAIAALAVPAVSCGSRRRTAAARCRVDVCLCRGCCQLGHLERQLNLGCFRGLGTGLQVRQA